MNRTKNNKMCYSWKIVAVIIITSIVILYSFNWLLLALLQIPDNNTSSGLFTINNLFTSTSSGQQLQDVVQYKHHHQQKNDVVIGPCAINFYGLPRKFKELVLTSIIQNIIIPNIQYKCDYYIHYYNISIELYDRGIEKGHSGSINPNDVLLLQNTIMNVYTSYYTTNNITDSKEQYYPIIRFSSTTNEQFYTKYNHLLDRIKLEKNTIGKYLYLPWRHNFSNTTIDNIIKSWYSQQSVWELMEMSIENEKITTTTTTATTDTTTKRIERDTTTSSSTSRIRYSRVGMFRIDVMYVTPINIYSISNNINTNNNIIDYDNKYAIVPSFSNVPVNDRMIYGPADAVRIWATGRFQRLQLFSTLYTSTTTGTIFSSSDVNHNNSTVSSSGNINKVQQKLQQQQIVWHHRRYGRYKKHKYQDGDGIHPETFLDQIIFPAIRDAGIDIIEYKPIQDLCFIRVRSDSSIRIADCGINCVNINNINYVQDILLNSICHLNVVTPTIPYLNCPTNESFTITNIPKQRDNKTIVWQGCEWKIKRKRFSSLFF